MLNRICGQIVRKMISFWAKTSFKLHKMSGKQIESSSIHNLILTTWRHEKLV